MTKNQIKHNILHHSKKLGKHVARHGVKAARRTLNVSSRATIVIARVSKHGAKKAHYHLAKKPHEKLMARGKRYAQWHQWQWHKHVHAVTAAAYVFIVGVMVFNSVSVAFAADLADNWDFSTQGDYTLDSGVEFNGNSVRLKTQEYASDANTAALFPFNESSGSTVDDISPNNNNGTTIGSPTFGTGNINNGLTLNGATQNVTVPDSASLSLGSNQSIEGWIKPNATFNNTSGSNQTVFDKGSSKMYLDRTTGKLSYEIANNSANSWTQIGNNRGQNNSWSAESYYVDSSVMYNGDLIVGLGYIAGSADVWRKSGTNWTKIGGDGVNSSWQNFNYEGVYSMAVLGDELFAGLGVSSADAEVWKCNLASSCTSWSKVGGDGTGLTTTHETVRSMVVHAGSLYIGGGDGAGDGDVYRYNGASSWTQVGGDALNSSWAASIFERVESLTSDGTYLYAGLGITAGDAEVWRWNGTAWTKIGGDAVNSSWADATFEYVFSLDAYGGNVYAGLGTTAGDAEVWRWNGTAWTKIGGDAVNSSWADATFEMIFSFTNDGTNLYAGLGSSSGDGEVWRWNGTAWTKIGGDGVNNSFGTTANSVYSMSYDTSNSKLYAGVSNAYGANEWEWNGTSWTLIGGHSINNSWSSYYHGSVTASANHADKLYFGLGNAAGDAVIYEYDGSDYSAIGGNGIGGSWGFGSDGVYENVYSLVSYGGNLYAGLGTSSGEGEIWRWNGSTWTQVGGDSLNSSWSTASYIRAMTVWNDKLYAATYSAGSNGYIYEYNGTSWTNRGGGTGNVNGITNGAYSGALSLVPYNDRLCVGFGASANMADVWCWTGSGNWSQVGGDGINSSWNSSDTMIWTLSSYNGTLIAGTSDDTNRDPMVWAYNGSTWTKIGGNNVNSSWSDGFYYRVYSTTVYNGELYVGFGYSTNNGHVWKYNGSTWSQVGGDNINGSWGSTIDAVRAMSVYKGKLYAGLGDTAATDAMVYVIGDNAVVESSTTSFTTNWTHVAATYNGSTAKIYVNGTEVASENVPVSTVDNSLPLLIGSGYGGPDETSSLGRFAGSIDEIRFSNNTRTSFNTKPYSDSRQAVTLNSAVRTDGIDHWDNLTDSQTTNGGSIAYRLSDDDGSTWKYWNGSAWVVSASTSDSNPVAVIDSNLATFPVTFDGIKWQAVLLGDGTQRVQLNSVDLASTSDSAAPDTNASAITAEKTNGGSTLNNNDWTNSGAPYFSWTAGTDGGSGILGYCLYLGTSSSGNPISTKGILGTSPLDTGGNCQFAVSDTNIDLATAGYLGTALTSSTSPYYLNVQAIDRAGNVHSSSEQFQFRFDNTAPNNPGFISAPSGFLNSKVATLTWPDSGGSAASDAHSNVVGLQYRIGSSGTWYGDSHSGSGDINDLLSNDGSYATNDPIDYDILTDGVNTFYFRTWDEAGNVSTSYVTAVLRINTTGAPSEPQGLNATPSTSTTNSFSFDWDAPNSFNTTTGQADKLSYCYTVNTLPTVNNCTYTQQGETTVGPSAFATQPGANTFYVVAKDDFNSINYSSYASTTFTANTPAPGMPINADIVDVSIKSSNNWRLAITWDQPTSVGAGIATYRVSRSTDNISFSQVGTSSSTSFVDTGLSEQRYYYKVIACDSANNCGADSTTVTEVPTGKFTTPAEQTSEAQVSNITTKRASISWNTDRVSDSKIQIGTTSGEYSSSEVGNSSQVTAHTIEIDNLAAGTTYYFKARWTDEDGNTGTSQEYSFTTAPAPVLKEVQSIKVGLSSATLQFTTKDANRVQLLFGKSDSFGGSRNINTSLQESTYTTDLLDLEDGTKYFYKILMFDSEGGGYESSIFSLITPPRPRISQLAFQPVEGEPTSTQRVTWLTNIPTTSIVSYGKTGAPTLDITTNELKTEHETVIQGLEDNSEYGLVAQGRDGDGNLAVSDRQVFETALDTRPPKVSDIVIEPTVRGSGAEARGQVVVTWKTDEPSTSQVAYAEGSSAVTFNNKTTEDSEFTTEHLIIVSELPTSKVYTIMPLSKDKSGNVGEGLRQPAIVGRASDSVLNIVLNTLKKVFGL